MSFPSLLCGAVLALVAAPAASEPVRYIGKIVAAEFSDFEGEGSERVIFKTKVKILNPDKAKGVPKFVFWDIASVEREYLIKNIVVFVGDESGKFPENFELLLPKSLYCLDAMDERNDKLTFDHIVEENGRRTSCIELPSRIQSKL